MSHRVNQVVLWDSIIQAKDKAQIRLQSHKTKYAFMDQGKNLRDRQVRRCHVGVLHACMHAYPLHASGILVMDQGKNLQDRQVQNCVTSPCCMHACLSMHAYGNAVYGGQEAAGPSGGI